MNANSVYMHMWHASWMSILVIGSFLCETTLSGGHQGDAHVTHEWGKLINPAGRGLEWIRLLHLGLLRRTVRDGGGE